MTAITQPEQAGAGLRRYASVLRTPGALQFAIPGIVGRMPMGMLSIAQVMLIVSVTGRYGTAGIVSAAGAVLFAIVTPRIARLADRYGQAHVLRPGRSSWPRVRAGGTYPVRPVDLSGPPGGIGG